MKPRKTGGTKRNESEISREVGHKVIGINEGQKEYRVEVIFDRVKVEEEAR